MPSNIDRAVMTLSGVALTPSRLETYDFKGRDGAQVSGSYFVTDLIQITEHGTFLVPVRSEFPVVERPDPSKLLDVPCLFEMRNGVPRFTAQQQPANGKVPPAPQRTSA